MAKQYRYMVTWGGEATYVTAASPLEAILLAADELRVNWKATVAEMDVMPLYEVKGGVPQW